MVIPRGQKRENFGKNWENFGSWPCVFWGNGSFTRMLNNVGLMCPFLKCYKVPWNEISGNLQRKKSEVSEIPIQCRKDAMVWAGFLMDQDPWCPVAKRPCNPPISYLTFTSDTVGFFSRISDLFKKVGVSSVGFDHNGFRIYSKEDFLVWQMSSGKILMKGGGWVLATEVFLEMVGLLLLFLCCPEKFKWMWYWKLIK